MDVADWEIILNKSGSGSKSLNYCFFGSGSWGWCPCIVTAQYWIENSWVLMVLSWGQNQQFASNFQEPARPAIHAHRLGLSDRIRVVFS